MNEKSTIRLAGSLYNLLFLEMKVATFHPFDQSMIDRSKLFINPIVLEKQKGGRALKDQ